jgi:hypothetical protein
MAIAGTRGGSSGDGVCDGCALGTTGLRDWTLEEIHLCKAEK